MLSLPNAKRTARLANGKPSASTAIGDTLPSALFTRMLCLERNRAERSGRRLVLMLIGLPIHHAERTGLDVKIQVALTGSTRETDIKGWYREGKTLGVIFTEIQLTETSVVNVLSRKVTTALHAALGAQQLSKLALSFHVFPNAGNSKDGEGPDDFPNLYPDLVQDIESKRVPLLVKRGLDIAGSLMALLLFGPLMILIAVAVKLTSTGPVLFRQERLGQSGKSFTFLKFRSMYTNTGHSIHEEYVKRLIANKADSQQDEAGNHVYKLQGDPRVTRLGRFLRRTSLDELPQFFNVLAGEMSLVGPRPPVRYEFASYRAWHRRRLMGVKPGITGYWQVEGRSRVKFDEMVRMDLAYARSWSLWLDIKILVQTPAAVLNGSGAC